VVVVAAVRTPVRPGDILHDRNLTVVEQRSIPSTDRGVVDMVADMALGRLVAGLGNSLVESLDET
jgi:hypothetical protein